MINQYYQEERMFQELLAGYMYTVYFLYIIQFVTFRSDLEMCFRRVESIAVNKQEQNTTTWH